MPHAKTLIKCDDKFRPKLVSSQESFYKCAIGTARMRCPSDFFIFVSSSSFPVLKKTTHDRRGLILSVDICGNVSGIFSGLLAFAFDHASGSYGLSGWQWYETLVQNMRLFMLTISCRLFLSEGLVTVVVGVAVWFLLPDCEFLCRVVGLL